jgi:hypothetical protein
METPKPPQKSFASKHPIWMIIIIGVPVVLFFNALANDGSSNNATTTPPSQQVAATQTDTPPANLLALKSINYYRNAFNEPCANGEVANISDQTLSFVEANINYNDKNGNLVTPDQTYLSVDNLSPGQTATFEDCADSGTGIVLAQTTISFTGEFGGSTDNDTIPFEDDTKQAAPVTAPASVNTSNQSSPAADPSPAPAPAATTANIRNPSSTISSFSTSPPWGCRLTDRTNANDCRRSAI